jgi:transposase
MEWPLEARESVMEVSVDMWGGFAKVIEDVFPKANIVYDRFHVMKIINQELNKIRKQCMSSINKLKIKHVKYVLMKNHNDLEEEEKATLKQILKCSKRLRDTYKLKEEFREIYETHQTPEDSKNKFESWMDKAAKLYNESIQTVKNHLDGICNYFLNRTTSGVMEGINNKIKLIKRQAYGFTNFEHLRMRLMAAFSD